jgi:glycosyltransferase involved in cell wall biosynthesis
MKLSVCFIERRDPETSSIEKVFRCLASNLSSFDIAYSFIKLAFGNDAFGMLRNLLAFRRPAADVYHITGHVNYMALVMPVRRTVLTVHDLTILKVRAGVRRYLIRKLFFELPVRRLTYITAISEKTKTDLVEATGCSEKKIRVIPNPLTVSETSHSRSFNTQKPVILQVGTAPHKNLAGVIRSLVGTPCKLRIIGKLSSDERILIERSGIDHENKVDLSNDEMDWEYANSDILVFCSTFEGFGLPIIEAQAFGLPVITSDVDPMKETAGMGAMLVDPSDPNAIHNAVVRLINEPELRQELTEKGRSNLARFSPMLIAGKYAELYKEVLRGLE